MKGQNSAGMNQKSGRVPKKLGHFSKTDIVAFILTVSESAPFWVSTRSISPRLPTAQLTQNFSSLLFSKFCIYPKRTIVNGCY